VAIQDFVPHYYTAKYDELYRATNLCTHNTESYKQGGVLHHAPELTSFLLMSMVVQSAQSSVLLSRNVILLGL